MPDPLRVNTGPFVNFVTSDHRTFGAVQGREEAPIEEEKRHVAGARHVSNFHYRWGRLSSLRFGARFVGGLHVVQQVLKRFGCRFVGVNMTET